MFHGLWLSPVVQLAGNDRRNIQAGEVAHEFGKEKVDEPDQTSNSSKHFKNVECLAPDDLPRIVDVQLEASYFVAFRIGRRGARFTILIWLQMLERSTDGLAE